MTEDRLRVGWADIADFLGMHERSAIRRRDQLKAFDVLHEKFSNTSGAAFNVCAYESKLKAWCAHKAKQGEKI